MLTQRRRELERRRRADIRLVVGQLLGISASSVDARLDAGFTHFLSDAAVPLKPRPGSTPGELEIAPRGRIIAGAGGVVLECQQAELMDRKYAVKVQRPSLLETRSAAHEQDLASLETITTARLSHRNVAYLVNWWTIEIPTTPRGDVVARVQQLEWIDGASDFANYIFSTPSCAQVVDALVQVMDGLAHIHSKGLVHWDMKSGNCLVDKTGTVKITDLGNARSRAPRDSDKYDSQGGRALTSRQNAPDEFLHNTRRRGGDSNRLAVTLRPRTLVYDRDWLDLYMVGRMIGRILGYVSDAYSDIPKFRSARAEWLPRAFPPDDDDAQLVLMGLQTIWNRLVLPLSEAGRRLPEEKRYYRTAEAVRHDLKKLLPEFGAAGAVSELHAIPQRVLRMPVSRNTEFTPRIRKLMDSQPVRRLTLHRQLGLTSHVYPGARHVRHEHSIGVLGATVDYVRALYADRTSPDFRLLCDEEHINALLFAALVHDIGHGAFAHYLEELPAMFDGCEHGCYLQAALRNDERWYAASDHDSGPLQDHATLLRCAESWCHERSRPTRGNPQDFLKLVADILQPPSWNIAGCPDVRREWQCELMIKHVLRSIVDGALDADKYDYVRRDAHHGGLDYAAGIDTDRFLQALTTVVRPPAYSSGGFRPTIAVTEKGVLPVESFLVARYQLFSAMYWHRAARGLTAVLKHLVGQYLVPPGRRYDRGRFESRRGVLLRLFREREDEECLRWLRRQLSAGPNVSRAIKREWVRLMDILENRTELPKSICEVAQSDYRRPAAWRRYEAILKAFRTICDLEPEAFAKEWMRVVRETWKTLHAEAVQSGARVPRLLRAENAVFIDIPLVSRDQVRNLFVGRREAGILDTIPFQKHSVMADAISGAFHHWQRRLRIFALPQLAAQLVEVMGRERLGRCAYGALTRALGVV